MRTSRKIKRKLRPVVREVQRRFGPRRHFRLATRRARILPSFLIIGAQRAGTTSLFDYLVRHPDISGPFAGAEVVWSRKELHFFDERFFRGLDWYRSFFPLELARRAARRRGGDIVAGEATPYYMFHPAVPGRVAATIPDMRMIVLLREPVSRAYSHHQMNIRRGHEELPFAEALAAEEERVGDAEERLLADPDHRSRGHRHHTYFARGLYAEQLERWYEHFPREQLLVLFADDYFARPDEIYEETLDFLGVRPRSRAEVGKRPTTAPLWLSHRAKLNRTRRAYTPIDPAIKRQLEERYAEPNARLARLLDRELPWGSPSTAEAAGDDAARGETPAG